MPKKSIRKSVRKSKRKSVRKSIRRKPIYCGNNGAHPHLRSGKKIVGTRYQCLQKGLNNGKNMPIDPTFLLPYRPIIKDKKYCGTKNNLPPGYDRFGGLHECYQMGVGVGKRETAKKSKSKRKSKRKSVRKSKRKIKRKSKRKSKRSKRV